MQTLKIISQNTHCCTLNLANKLMLFILSTPHLHHTLLNSHSSFYFLLIHQLQCNSSQILASFISQSYTLINSTNLLEGKINPFLLLSLILTSLREWEPQSPHNVPFSFASIIIKGIWKPWFCTSCLKAGSLPNHPDRLHHKIPATLWWNMGVAIFLMNSIIKVIVCFHYLHSSYNFHSMCSECTN